MSSGARRVWMWIGGATALLILLGLAGLALGVRWAQRHSDWPERLPNVRLEPVRPILTAADITTNNAFFYLREITNCAVTWDSEEWHRFQTNGWTSGTYTGLDAAVVQAAPCLELLARAAAMTSGQVESVTRMEQLMPYITPFLKLARLQSGQLGRAFALGETDAALAVFDQTLANTAHLDKGAPLITRLVTIAADMLMARELHRALTHGQLPASALRPAADRLRRRLADTEPWAETMRYEYLASINAISLVYTGNLSALADIGGREASRDKSLWMARPYLALLGSSPADTRRHFDAVYSHLIDRADEPWRLKEFEQSSPVLQRVDVTKARVLVNDPIGRILIALLVPSLDSATGRHTEHRAALETLRLTLLVEAYRHEHGTLPDQLDQLVPAYLDEVPRDPCVPEGKLIYRRENEDYCIYGRGANGRDDGGIVTPPDPSDYHSPDTGWRTGNATK